MKKHTRLLLPWLAVPAAVSIGLAQTSPATEEVVELSPFTVQASQDMGYMATSTLAGTRLNTDLKDVGAAVSVYTPEFLDDIGATSLEDILTYTLSTEGGGINGNFSSITGESSDGQRDDPSGVNRVRGLATATRTRDYFASDIPSDTYNFGSLTISRGPNAILAGIGSAGGIIDAAVRKAAFKDSAQFVSRLGNYGTHREELHVNRVLVRNRFAVRADLLNNREIYRQDPAYTQDRRAFVAATLRLRDPGASALVGRTTVRANLEVGHIEGTPPELLTPSLSMNSWFDNGALSHWYTNGALQKTYDAAGNVIAANAVTQGFPMYRHWGLVYANPNASDANVGFADPTLAGIQGFMGTIPAGTQGPGGWVHATGDPMRTRAGFYRTRIMDPRIFNFYDHLMSGAFDFREQSFNAVDVRLEQLLLGGDAGFEAAYNKQTFERTRDFPITGGDMPVYIDTNKYLSIRSDAYPNGIPNPNFGRPFIVTRDAFADQTNRSERESWQATGFIRHDFGRPGTWLGRMVGLNTLSGLLFKTNIAKFNRTFSSTWDPAGPLNPGASLGAAPGLYGSMVNAWFYLGDSLANVEHLADVRLSPITASRPEYGQTYTLRVYDPVTKTFVTGPATPLRILTRIGDTEQDVTSQALTLQSRWLADHVTTLVGWRRDKSQAYTAGDLPRLPDGNLDFSAYTMLPSVEQTKESWTKSVVARAPKAVLRRLPFDADLRVYWNESDNFNPVGQRRNVWNEELGSPSASTTEYGVGLSLFRGKLDLRINHFETKIHDDTIGGVENPYGYISSLIGRMVGANTLNLKPADYGYAGFNTFEDVARAIYATIPQRLRDNMGPERNFDPHFVGTGANLLWQTDSITNFASTSDTVSKGMEYEAVWNVTRAWRLAVNVAENEAVKADVARQELAFANEWMNNVKTMYNGSLAKGWRNPPTESGLFLSQYQVEHVSNIKTDAALSGTSTPEVRKWRANLITRYDFRAGALKGFNVTGTVRWQDKVGIGYPYVTDEAGLSVADIAHPYYGPRETQYDLALGYQRKLRRGITWTVRASVRNLTAKDELIPIAANADGTYGTVRIPPDRQWLLSNSFSF